MDVVVCMDLVKPLVVTAFIMTGHSAEVRVIMRSLEYCKRVTMDFELHLNMSVSVIACCAVIEMF